MAKKQTVAEIVVFHRQRLGLSIGELANITGLSESTISRTENGLSIPQNSTLGRLADGLHLPYQELFDARLQVVRAFGGIHRKTQEFRIGLDPKQKDNVVQLPKRSEQKSLPKLPPQDPMVRIEANKNSQLELQSSFSGSDDLNTMRTYQEEFLRILSEGISRYTTNTNRPQADHFLPRYKGLYAAISKPVEEINFAFVYASLTRLRTAHEAAKQELANPQTEWPHFEPEEQEALDAMNLMSGPFIMSSAEGRKLVTDTSLYNLRESDEGEVDAFLSFYLEQVRNLGVASPETDAFLEAVDVPVEGDGNPQRTRRMKFAVVGSLMVLTAGSAALFLPLMSAGGVVAVGATAFLPTIFAKKVIENDPDFKVLTGKGGKALDATSAFAVSKAGELLKKLGGVFSSNLERISVINQKVSEISWTKAFVDLFETSTSEEQAETADEYLYLFSMPNDKLAKLLEHGFSRARDGKMSVHHFEFDNDKVLRRFAKLSRPGDFILFLWDEQDKLADALDSLSAPKYKEALVGKDLIVVTRGEPKASSRIWKYAASERVELAERWAPTVFKSLGLAKMHLYQLKLPRSARVKN